MKKGKQRQAMSPEKVAERGKPNWKAIGRVAVDRVAGSPPDASSPELAHLRRKYLGALASSDSPTSASPATRIRKGNDVAMIVMEPKQAADTRPGRKVVIVDQGKIIGEQG